MAGVPPSEDSRVLFRDQSIAVKDTSCDKGLSQSESYGSCVPKLRRVRTRTHGGVTGTAREGLPMSI